MLYTAQHHYLDNLPTIPAKKFKNIFKFVNLWIQNIVSDANFNHMTQQLCGGTVQNTLCLPPLSGWPSMAELYQPVTVFRPASANQTKA